MIKKSIDGWGLINYECRTDTTAGQYIVSIRFDTVSGTANILASEFRYDAIAIYKIGNLVAAFMHCLMINEFNSCKRDDKYKLEDGLGEFGIEMHVTNGLATPVIWRHNDLYIYDRKQGTRNVAVDMFTDSSVPAIHSIKNIISILREYEKDYPGTRLIDQNWICCI